MMDDQNTINNTNKIKVLLVEDDEFNRELYYETFRQSGHTVFSAENGVKALELIEVEKPDLVVLDIQMPVLNGMETLREIKTQKEKYGEPVVVMLTSMTTDPTIEQTFEQRADGYLIKHELLPDEIVNEALDIYFEKIGK